MIVSGILRNLTGAPIPKGLIQIVATVTSEQVLCGSDVYIQCDHEGAYYFTLLNGSYKIYAQPSRCSDIAYQGETVITSDTADGDLNTIIGITTPVLPPQVEQAINAANQSAQSALQAKSEKEQVLVIAAMVDNQSDQVAVNTAQAAGFAQTASDNASGANNAKNAAVKAKDDAVKQVDIANDHQTATAQLKQDVALLKSQTETFSNNASSSAQVANTAKASATKSAENAAVECQQAFKAAGQAQAHSKTASDYADRAEQALSATDGALESVTAETDKAKGYSNTASSQAQIATKAKESSIEAQINSSTAAAISMQSEIMVDQVLADVVQVGKQAAASVEQTANNVVGADLAAKDAAKANQQAQIALAATAKHALDADNSAALARDCLDRSVVIHGAVSDMSQQVSDHEKTTHEYSVSALTSSNNAQQAERLSLQHSQNAVNAESQSLAAAREAKQHSQVASDCADRAEKTVNANTESFIAMAGSLILTQAIIISLNK